MQPSVRLRTPAQVSSYRPEIDGLRGLSVLAVLFFHLKIAPFRGGYVGVDVFFVISGYLITRIIVNDLDSNNFSLLHFYSRRIRRLFPALFFTVATTLVAAILWFPPDALQQTAMDAITALGSVSNFQFWLEANQYFAPNFQAIPLIHSWSLGVEDQFYLLWPIALVFAAKLRKSWGILAFVFATSIVSLVLSQHWLSIDAAAAFYLMPFRIFELGIGALCVWTERWQPRRRAWSELSFMVGIAAILLAMALFNARTPFPGLRALLPCAGAALIIHAGQRASASAVLSNRIAVGIGLISYSLYLCHWPLIVFCRYVLGELDIATKLMLILLSFGSAIVMYAFVEQPFRRAAAPVTPKAFLGLVARVVTLAMLVVLPARFAVVQRGWEWRLDGEQQQTLLAQRFGSFPCTTNGLCVFGKPDGALGLQVLGDSHAQQWIAAFDPLLSSGGLSGQSYAAGGCPMLVGLDRVVGGSIWTACRDEREHAIESIRSAKAPVVIAASFHGYTTGSLADSQGRILSLGSIQDKKRVFRDALLRTLEHVGGATRRVLVIGQQIAQKCDLDPYRVQPGPLKHASPPPCSPLDAKEAHRQVDDIDSMLLELAAAYPQSVTILRPVDYLCDSECPVMMNGRWLFQDGTHLTVAGARYAAMRSQKLLVQFLTGHQEVTLPHP